MLKELANVYRGKRVFLTGHTGFKGAWLLKVFNMLGAEVKGYALEPYSVDDIYLKIGGDTLCQSVIADLRDKATLHREMAAFQPDFVFHLAAQPLVRLSYNLPVETFEINVIGTANVVEGVKNLKNKCDVILITTDKVYHNNEWDYPYREVDRLGGYDPYSASKACSELVIDSYRNSFFNTDTYDEHQKAIAVGRAGNVIGGGDWSKDRLIPDIARALIKQETIVIRNPCSVRPWQHVLEPLSGYLLLGAKLNDQPRDFSQAYNFGPEATDALPVIEMVKLALAEWGNGDYVIENNGKAPHEAGLLKLDISKAVKHLNWNPRLDANNAVKMTIDWYKCFYNQGDLGAFTKQQINDFFSYGSS